MYWALIMRWNEFKWRVLRYTRVLIRRGFIRSSPGRSGGTECSGCRSLNTLQRRRSQLRGARWTVRSSHRRGEAGGGNSEKIYLKAWHAPLKFVKINLYLGCSGMSWKAYWGIVLNTSLTWAPEGMNFVINLSTVTSDASVRGLKEKIMNLVEQEHCKTYSTGRSVKSEVSFFCLGSGLVCFLNSVVSWPSSEWFLRVVIISSSIISSAAIMASRSVEIVLCSSGPASCRVLRPAWKNISILKKLFSSYLMIINLVFSLNIFISDWIRLNLEDCWFISWSLSSSLHFLLLLESPEVVLDQECCVELANSNIIINCNRNIF